jgi:hypothetical protein
MSFVTTQPELLGEAAVNLQGIGSAMTEMRPPPLPPPG